MTYWVTLKEPIRYRGADRQSFSVDGETEHVACATAAKVLGIQPGDVLSCEALPYPGEPRLDYQSGDCPSFCMHPAKCAGRTSCPRKIACSE